MAADVCFGAILADAGYGLSASFRQGLSARGLAWAVGWRRGVKGPLSARFGALRVSWMGRLSAFLLKVSAKCRANGHG